MSQTGLGRKRDQRNLLLRNLATSVILYESVTTTEAKARNVQPIVDRMIYLGQAEDKLTARRRLQAYLTDEKAVLKVLNELSERFNDRTSGFTRRFRLPARIGDGAAQAVIQLTKTVLVEAKPAKAAAKTEKTADAKASEGDSHD